MKKKGIVLEDLSQKYFSALEPEKRFYSRSPPLRPGVPVLLFCCSWTKEIVHKSKTFEFESLTFTNI